MMTSHSDVVEITVKVPALPISNWPRKLGIEQIPSESESSSIKDILAAAEVDFDRLKQDIDRVKQVLDRLSTRRWELSSFIARHRALVAPVRRLPVDCLVEIFMQCLRDIEGGDDAELENLTLTHVCRRWRSIAILTPALWSTIRVDRKGPDAVEEITTRLERSGSTMTLSITIDEARPSTYPYSSREMGEAVKVIIPSCGRWRHLTLTSVSPETLETLDQVGDEFVSLQSLYVINNRIRSFRAFKAAPQLRRLRLWQGTWPHFNQGFYPSTTLTHLQAWDVEVAWHKHHCFDILQGSPSLIVCDFGWILSTPLVDVDISNRQLRHENLRELQIAAHHVLAHDAVVGAAFTSRICQLLDCLTLPNLRVLELGGEGGMGRALSRLISRSSCDLESLSWIVSCAAHDDFVGHLTMTPNLTYLYAQVDESSPLLQVLTVDPANSATHLCPHLSEFRYRVTDESPDCWPLVDMVRSRRSGDVPGGVTGGCVRLRKVVLRCDEDETFQADQVVETLRGVGWDNFSISSEIV